MNLLKRINQKLPRMLDILFDNSEHLQDSPEFRFQIIRKIWNEPLNN
jgi:hypothetical protein